MTARTAPKSVDEYLHSMPPDRREAISRVREVILANLPAGYEEGIQYGMIGYYVPHSLYPAGYHTDPKQPLPFVHLASQKSHMALYLMCVYGDADLSAWFTAEYAKSGKKLDMGKSCLRFRRLGDLPLDLVGRLVARVPVARYIESYERAVPVARGRAAKAPPKKVTAAAKSLRPGPPTRK